MTYRKSTAFFIFSNATCTGKTRYTVYFDSNKLEFDCVNSESGCKLRGQLTEIIEVIKAIGQFGTCAVNEVATEEAMKQEIDKRKIEVIRDGPFDIHLVFFLVTSYFFLSF